MKKIFHLFKCVPLGILTAVPLIIYFIIAMFGAFCGLGYKLEHKAERLCGKLDKKITAFADVYWKFVGREQL